MTRHRYIRVLLMALSLATAAGCGRGGPQPPPGQPRDPLLANLKPPPLNLPVTPRPVPAEGNPRLPPGRRSALLVFSEGPSLGETRTVAGQLAITPGRIQCTAQGQPPINVLYRLPQGLSDLRASSGNGRIVVIDQTTPGTRYRQVLISRDDSLVLGEIGLKSSEPLTADLGVGLRLNQMRASIATGSQALAPAAVQVFAGDKLVATISAAVPTKIETPAGTFQVFVETSHLAYSSAPNQQHPGGYVLEAWVVRLE